LPRFNQRLFSANTNFEPTSLSRNFILGTLLCGNLQKYKSDVTNQVAVNELYKAIKDTTPTCPDLLVNCAGITRDVTLLKMTENQWDDVMSVNLKSLYLMTQCYSLWVKNEATSGNKLRDRAVVNISSINGKTGAYGQTNYAASKSGVIGFTKSSAKELAGLGIRCNAVSPGFIDTAMTRAMPKKVQNIAISQIPLQRPGTPEDVAKTVLYLGTDLSGYVTGQNIEVTGGLMM